MDGDRNLEAVRRDIDAIDDAIHDLLIKRTALVETVRSLKANDRIKIRPAREAEIVYRLIARHHGPFPRRELVAIWRLIITATLSFEGSFSVAVHMPQGQGGYWDLARDHFGIFTPVTRHTSVRSTIEAVHRQDATVGVLPMPQHDEKDPWWRHLVTTQPDAPRIIAKLPLAGPSNSIGGDLEALVICPVEQPPTGRDRSYLAFEMEKRLGINQFKLALEGAGLNHHFTTVWREEQGPKAWLFLAEIGDYVATDDPRLADLEDRLGAACNRMVRLGTYAEPLNEDELGPPRHRRPASNGSAQR